ncbi:hypothetical protein GYA19_02570 [Candidatus Beckwithbacteria bacterium]|nr:hypothetical protein [Candidatus Beckwithbacteria bacterium]
MKTILFTGGHYNSALILAQKFQTNGYLIIWFGHQYSFADKKSYSQEYLEVTKNKIKFVNLETGKFHRASLASYFKIIKAFLFCLHYFAKNKIEAVVSFGGFLAVPPVFAAFFYKIPSFAHEQTVTMGLANKTILPLVKRLYLTWEKSQEELAAKYLNKTMVVGLPINKRKLTPFSKKNLNQFLQKEFNFQFNKLNKPLILISGGKQGCHFINNFIEENLDYLLTYYNLIHQTGNNTQTQDFNKFQKLRETLSKDHQSSYLVFSYSDHFSQFLQAADLVIGRSGAHTVYDLLLFKKKILAIPLPFAYAQEQLKNALILKSLGLCEIIEQNSFSSEKMKKNIKLLLRKQIKEDKIDNFIKEHIKQNSLNLIYEDIRNSI